MNLFIAKVVWTFDPTSSHRNPDEVGGNISCGCEWFFSSQFLLPFKVAWGLA